jgi:hypothetical protein
MFESALRTFIAVTKRYIPNAAIRKKLNLFAKIIFM